MRSSSPLSSPASPPSLLPRVRRLRPLVLTPLNEEVNLEIIGITRLIEGKETDLFVVACPEHNYFYKGKPPLTHSCRECWEAYFFGECARDGNFKDNVDKLEEVIRHAGEAAAKGDFDFTPGYEIDIQHEN